MTSPEGTQRLICDADLDDPDPGNGGNGPDPEDPDFGTFVGQSIWVPPTDASIPKYTIGLSDLSIEWIILPRDTGDLGDPIDPSVGSSDFGTLAGICKPKGSDGDVLAGITNVKTINSFIQCFWKGVNVTAANAFISPFIPRTEWTHLCCNYDRSGDLELFDDAVSAGTADISGDVAESIGEQGIYPMVSENTSPGNSDNLTDNPSERVLPWFSPIAGFAVHSRILTLGEIATNSLALNTGDYPETVVRYNFRTFVDGSGTRVIPPRDTDLDHISVFNKWEVPVIYGTELFTPEGANDTLHIEDLSGNGRHFGIQTLSTYTNLDVADRGKSTFTITGRTLP